jgi:hypothetical protein
MKKTWLQHDLEEWAMWRESSESGYSSETILYRKAYGGQDSGLRASHPPTNSDAPTERMQRLIIAMADARTDRRTCKAIDIMRQWYLDGAKATGRKLKKHHTTLWRWKKRGEAILRLKLRESSDQH